MRPTILLSLCFIHLVPACATEAPIEDPVPIYGVEPQLPCAAVGYRVGDVSTQDRFVYRYDDDGREDWFHVTYADGSMYARGRRFRDGALENERIATPDLFTERSFRYEADGLSWTGFYEERTGTPPTWTRYQEERAWRADGGEHASLVQFRRWLPETGAETVVRYEALAGEDGFREETCATGAACTVVEYVGPHAYVGDTSTWTEMRREDGTEMRVFDEQGLITSHVRRDRAGVLLDETTWTRDADGTMRAWERDTLGQPSYRYEPQYLACPWVQVQWPYLP
jgi:hypothetical protein